MPRYIDAEAFIKEQCNSCDGYCEKVDCDCLSCDKPYQCGVIQDLKNAPTVSPDDVRGVVHCKDCKWCHAGYCEKYDDLIPWGCANKPWEDWFCADGKRREAIKEAQNAD